MRRGGRVASLSHDCLPNPSLLRGPNLPQLAYACAEKKHCAEALLSAPVERVTCRCGRPKKSERLKGMQGRERGGWDKTVVIRTTYHQLASCAFLLMNRLTREISFSWSLCCGCVNCYRGQGRSLEQWAHHSRSLTRRGVEWGLGCLGRTTSHFRNIGSVAPLLLYQGPRADQHPVGARQSC